jgi:hypothetical protein
MVAVRKVSCQEDRDALPSSSRTGTFGPSMSTTNLHHHPHVSSWDPPTIVRIYEGVSRDAAMRDAAREAHQMEQQGYVIANGRWSPPGPPTEEGGRAVRWALVVAGLAAITTTLALWWFLRVAMAPCDAGTDAGSCIGANVLPSLGRSLLLLLVAAVVDVVAVVTFRRARAAAPTGVLVVTWAKSADGAVET